MTDADPESVPCPLLADLPAEQVAPAPAPGYDMQAQFLALERRVAALERSASSLRTYGPPQRRLGSGWQAPWTD